MCDSVSEMFPLQSGEGKGGGGGGGTMRAPLAIA